MAEKQSGVEAIVAQVLEEIRHLSASHVELIKQQHKMDRKVEEHIESEEDKLSKHLERFDSMDARFDALDIAFPNGDREGHRRYHETVIQKLEQQIKFRQAVIEKTLAGLVWSGLVAISAACWHYLQDVIHK